MWSSTAFTAIKVFALSDRCRRECEVYARLRLAGIRMVAGHSLPELLDIDDRLGVIEMTIVRPPFVLDFASAALDHPPEFPEEVLAD